MRPRRPTRRRIGGWWFGAVAAVLFGALAYIPFFGKELTHRSFDLPLLFKRAVAPEDFVIVYLDAESHDKLGQRFEIWDRKLHAQLLRRLKEENSREVIFDLVFDQPSVRPEDDIVFAQALRDHGKAFVGVHYKANVTDIEVRRPIPIIATNGIPGAVSVMSDDDDVVRALLVSRESGGEHIVTFTWNAAASAGAPVTHQPRLPGELGWLNYYGPPGTFAHRSYYEALSEAPAGYFTGKFVLVGSPADIGFAGAGLDTFKSPFRAGRARFAGVEIQATALANLIRSEWLTGTPRSHAALLVVFGLAIGLLLVRFRPVVATVIALAAAGLAFVAACVSSWYLHFWFPWLTMVLVQIPAAWGWSVLFHWLQGKMERQFLEQSLSMYLSPKLVKQFSRNKDISLLKPGATKQKLTILFSDIANFTSMSEGMDSDELALTMNEYFERAVGQCIHPSDGTVVKYIGDAIFSFWNAPEPQADHAARACEAALRFREAGGRPVRGRTLVTRIGLHTGVANVGNFGSATRVDYTAIGEDVNLASRMEGLNKYLGTTVLMTGAVKEEIGNRFGTRYLGRFQLKGFERAVEVHELTGSENGTAKYREFEQALHLFRSRQFPEAERLFASVLEADPHDGPAKFYLKHLGDLRDHPLPADWNGEVELKEK